MSTRTEKVGASSANSLFDKYNDRLCYAISGISSLSVTKNPIDDEQAKNIQLTLDELRKDLFRLKEVDQSPAGHEHD